MVNSSVEDAEPEERTWYAAADQATQTLTLFRCADCGFVACMENSVSVSYASVGIDPLSLMESARHV